MRQDGIHGPLFIKLIRHCFYDLNGDGCGDIAGITAKL